MTGGSREPPTGRTKAALLWGVVAGFAFLVLLQAYHLSGGRPVSIPASVGATVAVALGGAGLAYVTEGWRVQRVADRE